MTFNGSFGYIEPVLVSAGNMARILTINRERRLYRDKQLAIAMKEAEQNFERLKRQAN